MSSLRALSVHTPPVPPPPSPCHRISRWIFSECFFHWYQPTPLMEGKKKKNHQCCRLWIVFSGIVLCSGGGGSSGQKGRKAKSPSFQSWPFLPQFIPAPRKKASLKTPQKIFIAQRWLKEGETSGGQLTNKTPQNLEIAWKIYTKKYKIDKRVFHIFTVFVMWCTNVRSNNLNGWNYCSNYENCHQSTSLSTIISSHCKRRLLCW